MKKAFAVICVLAQMACSRAIHAQSLGGVWVSDHVILELVNFSITFNADKSYRIDCILGKAKGTYTIDERRIFFTPTDSTINNPQANDVGSTTTYAYIFVNENTLRINGGPLPVTLIRKEDFDPVLNKGKTRGLVGDLIGLPSARP